MSKYSIEDTTLTAIGDAIRAKGNTEDKILVSDLATAITNLPTGGGSGGDIPEELLHYSGDCRVKFSYTTWNWIIEKYGNQITTNNITNCISMFEGNNKIEEIPFELNIGSNVVGNNMFRDCNNLTRIAKINFPSTGVDGNYQDMFSGCQRLKEVPEMTNFFSKAGSKYRLYQTFTTCYSLKNMPDFIGDFYKYTTSTTTDTPYSGIFNNCLNLVEITCVPYYPGIITTNSLSNTFNKCSRAKSIKFKYQDDTIPEAQWKSQTLDLSKYVGYFASSNSYDSSASKVIDDATYQELKDTSDWYTLDINYSRYNHDSAVETINNLPDTSAYLAAKGGTNTIKFTGAAGALTDGGAINTLTEEEIAVAAAKGWTVTFA